MMRLLVLAFVVAAVIGAACLVSAPFRTRVRIVSRELTEWTPKNIADDPEGFLAFCQDETRSAIQRIMEAKVALHQGRGRVQAQCDRARKHLTIGRPLLADAKALFRKARSEGDWPVRWRGKLRNESWLKEQIVRLQRDVDGQERKHHNSRRAVAKYSGRIRQAEDELARAHALLTRVRQRRDALALHETSESIDEILVSMNASVEALDESADELNGFAPLEQLVQEANTSVSEEDFEAILNR